MAYQPSCTPTPGPYWVAPGTNTVWSGNGDTQVALCQSAHLSREGNAANARHIAQLSTLPDIARRAETILRGLGIRADRLSERPINVLLADLQRAIRELDGEA
jgi:hypothetical protein